jgi:hypothetical protein
MQAKAPTMSQLKEISDAILREGLRFKQGSEQPERIEREIEGCKEVSPAMNVKSAPPENATMEEELKFQRLRFTRNVFKEEEAKLKLETVMANRDMLTRMIFDYKTGIEATKLKKQGLQEESERLADDFKDRLDESAAILGELLWRNEMLREEIKIARMTKN